MNQEIKQRIEQIKNGEVPNGYKKTKIGIVPNEWEENRLENIAPLQRGFDLPSYEINTGVYPICCSNGIIGYHNKFKVKGPGVWTGRSGTIGKVFYIEKNYWAHNTSLWVTNFINSIPKYIFYLYTFIDFSKYNAGSTVPTLNRNDIHSLKIVIPSISEQQKIVDILSTQDKVIELKEKLLKEKEKQKKYLMQILLTGKKRLKGFDGEWKKVKLGDIGYSFTGLNGKTKEDFGEGKPYIPYINIFQNPIVDIKNFNYVNIFEDEKQSKVRYGDIFFTTSSEIAEEVGMSSVLLDHVGELYLNSFCFGFRLNDFSVLFPEFASHYFRGNYFRIILNKLAQGATRFNLSKNNLLQSEIILPPLEEQKAIAEILTTADRELKLLQEGLEEEKRKKKALMQLLLTGIVRVNS